MILDTRLGNAPRWYLSPPEDFNMRVPDEIRDCVIFLGVRVMRPDGYYEDIWGGTGFLIGVKSEMFPDSMLFTYAVTAKHVADEMQKGVPIIRVNTKTEGAVILLLGADARWHFHTDADHVDVAVMPIGIAAEHVEFKLLPNDMFLTDEIIREKGIGTGDEVFMTGLFVHLTGTGRNLPIVRMGNVAMMPTETVPTAEYGNIEAYLIEARSIGGLSGSPVFVRQTAPFPGQSPFFLMGLMHGHWRIPIGDVNATPSTDAARWNETINMGIAIVVPAKKIMEALNVPELRASRAKQDEAERAANLPVMDSVIPEMEEHKGPAKPVSLYPMSEEEALKRLLRVPPPEKNTKD